MKKTILKTSKEVYEYLGLNKDEQRQVDAIFNSVDSNDIVSAKITQIIGAQKAKVVMDFADANGALII